MKCGLQKMQPKRKVVFNPDVAKARAKKAKNHNAIYRAFEEAGQALLSLIESNSEELSSYAPSSIVLEEILLVATMGLKGVQWLNISCKSIPINHPHRLLEIKSMLNFSVPQMTTTACEGLINRMTRSTMSLKSEKWLLDSFEIATGQPTLFLSPPVQTCQNNLCRRYGVNSLCANHNSSVKSWKAQDLQ